MRLKLPNTPCCKYVKAFVKWVWNFLFSGRRFILNFIILPFLTAYAICLLWGYYTSNVWVFNPFHYRYLPEKEKLAYLCMIAYILFVIAYALIMQRARSQRLDCSLRNIHIVRLAKLWLDEDRIKAQMQSAYDEKQRERMEKIEEEAANRMLIVSTEIVGRFISERLAPYLRKFSNEEIEIVRFLLNLLEKRGNCSSVASKFKNDYDIKQFKRCNGNKDIPVTSDGRTSYDILSAYSLLDHSIRVASMIIDEVKSRTNTYSILMPKAIIVALAHDIGKAEKIAASAVIDEVAKATDHPYLSAMIIKERFPEYSNIDEIVSIVQQHHLPIDKSGSICAQALKAADQRARREEIKRWFIKTYGSEAKSVDPYLNITIGWDIEQTIKQTRRRDIEPIMTAVYTDEGIEGEQDEQENKKKGKGTNGDLQKQRAFEMPSVLADEDYDGEQSDQTKREFLESERDDREWDNSIEYDEETGELVKRTSVVKGKDSERNKNDSDGKITGDSNSQLKPSTSQPKPSTKTTKSKFGETKTPNQALNNFATLKFDLGAYEEAILDRIRGEPIAIDRSGVNMFVPTLNIGSIPCDSALLVSFARLTGYISGIFISDNGELDFGAMSRYAVNEWRKRNIVLFVGEGYSTLKYEYLYNEEQRKVINMIPFSLDALGLNADDLIERAKDHPLYGLIGEIKMAKG
jgi:hypothetical protein